MKICPRCQSTYPNDLAFCSHDGTLLTQRDEWRAGAVVREKYRILEKVGQGGMGAVYKVMHLGFDELFALKVLAPDMAGNEEAVKRFRKEAAITRRLKHPNVVQVLDIDKSDGKQPFIVMEYIEGRSVAKVIAAEGSLSALRTCAIIKQVASALDATHRLGLIHRDIKPDNIALLQTSTGEQAKVLDFGIAKLREDRLGAAEGGSITQEGITLGTPEYMSPEQAMGRTGDKLDARSDLYSLGVTMYQMLTGQLPFEADSPLEKLLAHVGLAPTPIREARPDVHIPASLADLVMKCLEKDPDDRPQSAAFILAELERDGSTAAVPSLALPEDRAGAVNQDSSGSNPYAVPVSAPRVSTPAPIPAEQPGKVTLWSQTAVRLWRPKLQLTLLAVLLTVALGQTLWFRYHQPAAPAAGGSHKSFAVLYFSNLSQDSKLDWLNRGLTELLSTNLTQIKGFDVLSPERIQAEVQRRGKKDPTELNPASAWEVARNTGVEVFITGTLIRIGPGHLRLDLQVQDTQSGQILFSDRAEAKDIQGIFGLVDVLTARLVHRFLPSANLARSPPIEDVVTSDPEALRHFQAGIDFQRRFLIPDALRELQQAVQFDPKFGLAYWHLSLVYRLRGDLGKSQELWPKIGQLQTRLPRRELLEFQAYEALWRGDTNGGRERMESLLNEFPRQDEARSYLADVLLYQGEAQRAIDVLREGLVLDPRDEMLLNDLGPAEAAAGNLAGALQASDQYMALRPNDPNPWDTRGEFLYQFGRDEEAVEAYRKTIALKPDFNEYADYLKLAFVYADQKKFPLADSALQEYGKRVTGTGQLYLAVFAGQFLEMRGDLEGARAGYRRAVRELAAGGENDGAAAALKSLATIALLTGEDLAPDVAFAREQKLSGRENGVLAILQAAQGDAAGLEATLQRYAAALPGIGPEVIERVRNYSALYAAPLRKDPQAAIAAAQRLPNSTDSLIRYPRGWAYLQTRNYKWAEQDLRTAILDERSLADFDTIRTRCPLRAALAQFYLGQVYEATGKRDQAVNEYQEFLSHFEGSHAHLPQIAVARAALQRSLP